MSAVRIIKGKNEYMAVQLPKTADLSKTKVGQQILHEVAKTPRAGGKFVKKSVEITEDNRITVGGGKTKKLAEPLNWLLFHIQTGKYSVVDSIVDAGFKTATA